MPNGDDGSWWEKTGRSAEKTLFLFPFVHSFCENLPCSNSTRLGVEDIVGVNGYKTRYRTLRTIFRHER